ncbi:hypothetical protein [Marinomonas sp. FW-1]|uniref:hypothetical protein n=1 Tax=Marinomonas sp. FW-1 TaxID=2071621 RepID=UPI0020C780EE|nr:hypothetical protein [Marinomonas sp. FW-1]
MTINGEDYSTTVDADGNWTVNVAGATFGGHRVCVTSSDAAGTQSRQATSLTSIWKRMRTVTVANSR